MQIFITKLKFEAHPWLLIERLKDCVAPDLPRQESYAD